MENVKCVNENKEKFVNYTKHVVLETARPEKRSNFHLRKEEVKQENLEYRHEQLNYDEEHEEYVEYVEEELEISRTDQQNAESVDINAFCRLCARNLDDLIPMFSEDGEYNIETECLKLMPPGLISKDDGLPQYSCLECLDKLQSCVSIIDGFVSNQNFFESE